MDKSIKSLFEYCPEILCYSKVCGYWSQREACRRGITMYALTGKREYAVCFIGSVMKPSMSYKLPDYGVLSEQNRNP